MIYANGEFWMNVHRHGDMHFQSVHLRHAISFNLISLLPETFAFDRQSAVMFPPLVWFLNSDI